MGLDIFFICDTTLSFNLQLDNKYKTYSIIFPVLNIFSRKLGPGFLCAKISPPPPPPIKIKWSNPKLASHEYRGKPYLTLGEEPYNKFCFRSNPFILIMA